MSQISRVAGYSAVCLEHRTPGRNRDRDVPVSARAAPGGFALAYPGPAEPVRQLWAGRAAGVIALHGEVDICTWDFFATAVRAAIEEGVSAGSG
jgi:hypothetical protein